MTVNSPSKKALLAPFLVASMGFANMAESKDLEDEVYTDRSVTIEYQKYPVTQPNNHETSTVTVDCKDTYIFKTNKHEFPNWTFDFVEPFDIEIARKADGTIYRSSLMKPSPQAKRALKAIRSNTGHYIDNSVIVASNVTAMMKHIGDSRMPKHEVCSSLVKELKVGDCPVAAAFSACTKNTQDDQLIDPVYTVHPERKNNVRITYDR